MPVFFLIVLVFFCFCFFFSLCNLFIIRFRYNESGQLGAGDTRSRTDSQTLFANVVFSRFDQFHSPGLHLPHFQPGLPGELPTFARRSGSPDTASCQNAFLAQTPAALQACPICKPVGRSLREYCQLQHSLFLSFFFYLNVLESVSEDITNYLITIKIIPSKFLNIEF